FLVQGADKIALDRSGNLLLSKQHRTLQFLKPLAYQAIDGQKHFLDAHYILSKRQIAFAVASYDKTKPLIIDPRVSYATILGGDGSNESFGIAVDIAGSAYVTGVTTSTNFPTRVALQSTINRKEDAFVAKLSSTGKNLDYSTYLGGTSADVGRGIAVDTSVNTYVTGLTLSTDFPTTSNALQQTAPQRSRLSSLLPTAFVSKINTVNSTVVYSTYFGGEASDVG